jgi:hypothetical protein
MHSDRRNHHARMAARFPHSDIPGSKRSVGSSPRLIAASHVLHRLLAPRHPPCALPNLATPRHNTKTTTNTQDARAHYAILNPTSHQTPTRSPGTSPRRGRPPAARGAGWQASRHTRPPPTHPTRQQPPLLLLLLGGDGRVTRPGSSTVCATTIRMPTAFPPARPAGQATVLAATHER